MAETLLRLDKQSRASYLVLGSNVANATADSYAEANVSANDITTAGSLMVHGYGANSGQVVIRKGKNGGNLTSRALFVEGQSHVSGHVLPLDVSGNAVASVALGSTAAPFGTAYVTNIGDSSHKVTDGYFTNLSVTNFNADGLNLAGTASDSFTINNDVDAGVASTGLLIVKSSDGAAVKVGSLTLSQAGLWQLAGADATGLSVTGTLAASGNTTLSGTLNAGASTLASASVTGNGSVGGNLAVTGTLTAGASTLASASVTGNESVGGNLTVTGTLASAGATVTTLHATGNTTLDGNVVLGDSSADAVTLNGVLTGGANATIKLLDSGALYLGANETGQIWHDADDFNIWNYDGQMLIMNGDGSTDIVMGFDNNNTSSDITMQLGSNSASVFYIKKQGAGNVFSVDNSGNTSISGNAAVTGTLSAAGTTVTTLHATGATTLDSTLSAAGTTVTTLHATGAATLDSTLAAGASTLASLTCTGGATVGGTLVVTNDATFNGVATFNGAISLGDAAADSLNIAATSTQSGPATFTGAVTIGDAANDNLTVNSTSSFLENVTVAAAKTVSVGILTTSGNTTLGDASGDTLTVNATSTFASPVTINSTLAANGTTVTTLHATGATTLDSTLSAAGTTVTTLHATGATTLDSTLSAAGTTVTTVHATGAATLDSTLSAGASTLSSLTVTGASALNGNNTIGDATSDSHTITGATVINVPAANANAFVVKVAGTAKLTADTTTGIFTLAAPFVQSGAVGLTTGSGTLTLNNSAVTLNAGTTTITNATANASTVVKMASGTGTLKIVDNTAQPILTVNNAGSVRFDVKLPSGLPGNTVGNVSTVATDFEIYSISKSVSGKFFPSIPLMQAGTQLKRTTAGSTGAVHQIFTWSLATSDLAFGTFDIGTDTAVAGEHASYTNDSIFYRALGGGVGGNSVTIALTNPGADGALSVAVNNLDVEVTLAYANGAPTSTRQEVVDAINADASASLLLDAYVADANGGTVAAALVATNLSGGKVNATFSGTAKVTGLISGATSTTNPSVYYASSNAAEAAATVDQATAMNHLFNAANVSIEDLTGQSCAANGTIATAANHVSGKILVWKNGIMLRGGGADFTDNGANGTTITMVSAVLAQDAIQVFSYNA